MANINFESLSPDQVAALSAKDRKNYDKWLAKQTPADKTPEEEVELVSVKAFNDINTTVFGVLRKDKISKVSAKMAEQLEAQGLVELAEEE